MKKFIGRVKEKGVFKESVSRILDGEEQRKFPRLFLFHGEGGLGKSMLLDECIKVAKETAKEKHKEIKVIKLDWDDYYIKKSTLPDDDTKVIKGLYTVFCEVVEKPERYFKDYIKKLQEIDKINKKVEDKRKDFSKEAKILAEGAKVLTGIPAPSEVVEKGLSSTLSSMYQYELEFREWLRVRRILPENDIILYENANHDLSIALVNGLLELSDDSPIILAVDTYERVDNEKIEDWFRTLFLKKILEAAPRIVTVLSGRNNHCKAYRDQFPDESMLFISLDDILFNTDEIKEFTRVFGLDINEEDIKKLGRCTLGIPMVVAEVCHMLKGGKPLDEVLKDFDSRTGQIKDIIEGMVDRFLKHCDNETKERVFHMAMLRRFDDDLLAEIWGVPVREVNRILLGMTERHSFIQSHRLHAPVRQFIRGHLVNEILSKRNSHVFDDFGKTVSLLGKCLEGVKNECELPEDLFTDETFQGIFLDYVNALIWTDRQRAFLEIRKHFLELLEFNHATLFEVLFILNELAACLSAKQKKDFKILFEGFLANAISDGLGRASSNQESVLFNFFESNNKSLTSFQRQLLAYKWAAYYLRCWKLDEATAMLDKTHELTTTPGKIKEKITAIYTGLGGQYAIKKSYTKSLKCCNKAIELDPEHAAAYINRGSVYSDQQDYNKAISDFNRAIEINPEGAGAYNNRGGVYYAQKDYGNALSDCNRAIEINPEYADAYINRGNVYSNQKDYGNAISDFNKAIEINPKAAIVYYIRGGVYFVQKDYGNAISDFNRAIEINPEYAEAYINRGIVYFVQKNYGNAMSDFNKAIEINPKAAIVYYIRGIAYFDQKDYDNALSDFNRFIEINPEYAGAYEKRGKANTSIGNYGNAISDFKKVIELKPEGVSAYLNLMELYIITDNIPEALEIHCKILSLSLEKKDKAILIYLETIAKKMTGADVRECEKQFFQIIKEDFTTEGWSFDEIENWLQRTPIPEEKKTFIIDKTEEMKKHKSQEEEKGKRQDRLSHADELLKHYETAPISRHSWTNE